MPDASSAVRISRRPAAAYTDASAFPFERVTNEFLDRPPALEGSELGPLA